MKVVQNDIDVNEVVVQVFKADGSEIDYSDIAEALIVFTKPDYNVVQGDMTVRANDLYYKMGTNEIACQGTVKAQIQLVGSSGERLTIGGFSFTVQPDPVTPWTVQSSSEYSILHSLIIEAQAAINDVEALSVWENYNSGTTYVPMNKVVYEGSCYINLVACQGILPTDETKWLKIVSRGEDGTDGVDGTDATIEIGDVTTGAPGTYATVNNVGTPSNAVFNFSIPKGDKGDPFTVDASDILANKSLYDGESKGFSFLATDTGKIYFKNSNTSGDWSDPIDFEGPPGPGVPQGGTAGQFLRKNSSEDYEASWSDLPINNTLTSSSTTEALSAAQGKALKDAQDVHIADYVRQPGYGTASGTNAKTISLSPAPSAYVDGMSISFKNTTQNTGSVTINVNSLGAKSILKGNGSVLASGYLKANSIYTIRYNGSNFILQGSDSTGNATPEHVLAGKTFSNDSDTGITGTMPNRAGDTEALAISRSGTTIKLRASNGYRDGVDDNVTYNEPNWIAANIPVGISMFGLAGSNPYKSGAEVNYKQLGLLEAPIVKMLPSSSMPRYNHTYKPTVYDCLEGDYLAVQATTNNLGVINIKTGVILWQETGQTLNIIGVTVKNGKIYALKGNVNPFKNQIIKVYNLTTGAVIATSATLYTNYVPHGIMADSDGYIYTFGVYAQGNYNQRIWVYNSSLSYVAGFGDFANDLVHVLSTPSGPPVFWNYNKFYRVNAGRNFTQWSSSDQIYPDYQSMVCTDNYVWSNPSKNADGKLSLFNISTGALVKTILTGITSYLTIIGRDEGDFIYAKDSNNFVHRIDTDGNTEMIYKFAVAHTTHISSYKRHIEYRPQLGTSYAARLEKITLP